MQAEPHVEKCPSAILFWPWAHVIVKGVSDGPVHHRYFLLFFVFYCFFFTKPAPSMHESACIVIGYYNYT